MRLRKKQVPAKTYKPATANPKKERMFTGIALQPHEFRSTRFQQSGDRMQAYAVGAFTIRQLIQKATGIKTGTKLRSLESQRRVPKTFDFGRDHHRTAGR
jgi:hypothetical protein